MRAVHPVVQGKLNQLRQRIYERAVYTPAAPTVANRTIVIPAFKDATWQLKKAGDGDLNISQSQREPLLQLEGLQTQMQAALQLLDNPGQVRWLMGCTT